MMRRARRRERDNGSAALVQHVRERDPSYPAGYGGGTVETRMMPIPKTATTAVVTGIDEGNYNGTSAQSGYTHRPYGSTGGVTSPSHFGGSTVAGTSPVELAEDRPAELPAGYTPYSDSQEANKGQREGAGW